MGLLLGDFLGHYAVVGRFAEMVVSLFYFLVCLLLVWC